MEFLNNLDSRFSDFFDAFFTLDSIAILVTAIISFLLGMLINRLRMGRKMRKLKQELTTKDNQISALNAQNKNLQEELEFKAADIQRATLEVSQLKTKAKRLETEKGQLHGDLYAANEEIEKLNGTNQTYSAAIEDLNDQILGLKTKNSQLMNEGGEGERGLGVMGGDGGNGAIDRLEALESKLNRLESENEDLKTRIGSSSIEASNGTSESTLAKLAAVDDKLVKLESENQLLQAELEKMKALRGPQGTYDSRIQDGADRGDANALGILGDASDVEVTGGLPTDKSVLRDHLDNGEDTNIDKDDLSKIDGIGPFIEKKLNDIGIYTYEQISEFDQTKMEQVTKDIGFFPGRIERDDWVGQAKRLMGEEETPEQYGEDNIPEEYGDASDLAAIQVLGDDDLKVVEGIGPKIEEVLKANGVSDLNTLANADVERLKEILHNAGSRYRLHDPTTWGDQARLAAAGEWDKLKTYQEYLKGGKDPS